MNNSTYIICRLSLELGCNLHVLTHSKFKCEMIQKPKKKKHLKQSLILQISAENEYRSALLRILRRNNGACEYLKIKD